MEIPVVPLLPELPRVKTGSCTSPESSLSVLQLVPDLSRESIPMSQTSSIGLKKIWNNRQNWLSTLLYSNNKKNKPTFSPLTLNDSNSIKFFEYFWTTWLNFVRHWQTIFFFTNVYKTSLSWGWCSTALIVIAKKTGRHKNARCMSSSWQKNYFAWILGLTCF